jgi:hypothetical protein
MAGSPDFIAACGQISPHSNQEQGMLQDRKATEIDGGDSDGADRIQRPSLRHG